MKPIRVMIVEDSPSVRELLRHIIESDSRFEVAAVAESGETALKLLRQIRPDIISMDIRLPGINGFETTQKIMEILPTPIVVVSASVEADDLNISMNALRAGALSVIEKPVGITNTAYKDISQTLLNQLKIMSEVKVVGQRTPRNLTFSPARSTPRPLDSAISNICGLGTYKILGLVTSTGGPNALLRILEHLPKNFPLPILIVQHITESFLESFVTWLDSLSHFKAIMVRQATKPLPGHIYIAQPDCHLTVYRGDVLPEKSPEVNLQRPSGTVTFQSMARYYKEQSIGVILTGMGEDGAKGLLEIKNAGGYTIAEDASTAVVYGMPDAAVRMGAVCESLPLDKIALRLTQLVGDTRYGDRTA